ncbi:hypothetical protein RGAI101_3597 [Roseobacter sp. GAI101]|nr:hypothetical protein RGAI101_3597 [Roseobacter sp. GAI101]
MVFGRVLRAQTIPENPTFLKVSARPVAGIVPVCGLRIVTRGGWAG